ncbi:MAG: ComEC/Rec2 family competence protein [Patescibacteria group bacterium]|nr:ComEC/Rec2 family competence protein [Patescibacteria group bacterium]
MFKLFIIVGCVLTVVTFYRLFAYHRPNQTRAYVSAFVKLNQPQNPVDKMVKELYPEPYASLLSGILVGTRANMPPDFYNSLQKTGTLHMIALSGQNISLVISMVAFLLKGLGKKLSSFITIITITAFIIFVGPSASVVRSGLMGGFAMLSIVFGRPYFAAVGLFISGLLMIVISPTIVFDIGWQLSFAATFGIIVLAGKTELKKGKNFLITFKDNLLFDLKTTLSAQIFTMPIVLFNFHNLSIIAPLSNVLILWSIPYLMYGGFGLIVVFLIINFVTVITSINFIFFPRVLSWLLFPLLVWFVKAVDYTGSLPLSALTIKSISLGWVYLYYGVVFLMLGVFNCKKIKPKNQYPTPISNVQYPINKIGNW